MYCGEKTRLREYRKEDAPQALAFINDPHVKRCLNPGIPHLLTLEDEEKWIAEQSAQREIYSFAVETLEEGRYLGGCGVNKVDWKNRVAEIGIFIGGKSGYGTDAQEEGRLRQELFREGQDHDVVAMGI